MWVEYNYKERTSQQAKLLDREGKIIIEDYILSDRKKSTAFQYSLELKEFNINNHDVPSDKFTNHVYVRA